MTRRRFGILSGALVGGFGLALFAWVTFDASFADEKGVVAIVLFLAATCIAGALFLVRRAPRLDHPRY